MCEAVISRVPAEYDPLPFETETEICGRRVLIRYYSTKADVAMQRALEDLGAQEQMKRAELG